VLVVRYLALLALVVWLGGMVALGLLVAPAVFRELQAADPTGGRVLAGALFGAILRQFHLLAYACGAIIFVSFLVLKFVGPPPRGFIPRISLVTAMLAVAAYSGVPVTREIASIQAQVSGPVSSLPAADLRRMRFDRLHQLSTSLMTANIALGCVLLFWYVRE